MQCNLALHMVSKPKWYSGKHIGRKLLCVILLLIVLIMMGYKLSPRSITESNNIGYETYVVCQGDTIWNIALEYNIYQDVREMVYEIKKINNIETNIIRPRQEILLPIK